MPPGCTIRWTLTTLLVTLLLTGLALAVAPGLPDAGQIGYIDEAPGANRELHLLDVGRGLVMPLGFVGWNRNWWGWSGDGAMYGYQLTVSDSAEYVDVLSGQRRSIDTFSTVEPVWSPDGRRALHRALVRFGQSPDTPQTRLLVTDFSTGQHTDLSDIDGNYADAAWSPDGSRIAYLFQAPGNHSAVYRVDADGTNRQRLTFINTFTDIIDWSPDGAYLLLTGSITDETLSIYAADGTLVTEQTVSGLRRPRWLGARSDRLLVWASHEGETGFYWLDWRAGALSRIIDRDTDHDVLSVSPDGRWVLFVEPVDDNLGLFLIEAAGGSPRLVYVARSGTREAILWSPDGERFMFGEGEDFIVADVDGTTLRRFTGVYPQWRPEPH